MKNLVELQHLLENPRFRDWVLSAGQVDNAYWEQWLNTDPTRITLVDEARTILISLQDKPVSYSDDYISQRVELALAKAKEQLVDSEKQSSATIYPFWSWINRKQSAWVAAASIILIIGTGLIYFWQTQQGVSTYVYADQIARHKGVLKEVVNERSKPMTVWLPDHSSVVLFTNSRLSYPPEFKGPNREVYLSGEAFFEVAKNANKPFFVYANELVTKVLGTSFSIRAFASQANVDVVVKSGKVAVFAQSDQRAPVLKNSRELTGMVLLPNQQATFHRSEVRLTRNLVDSPTLLSIPIENQHFKFSGTPINQVFATLENAYGVDIVFDEEVMASCSITATLEDEPLFTKLNWICSIIEAKYVVTDGQIVVSGKPCN
ncbi:MULTISPECIES: FecR family protein [unclassified Spirosoma]|uniref:FecR family protein n=1 Tax=unclassified Spirosoma TaxID=2621999 RepID=UPI000964EFCC|nr:MULTISPECIES: FecR family protein [unclassified Spirosoma]MBN8822550.1 FecR family protein [Spirosoma sp.]OJW74047.1 MAG: hypothetical protein BGO59_13020 [Spirosoma sp. 48-14]